ncbi:MAG: hypothetical protein ACRESG_01950 [Gammaproteobacteria bacterium]
MTTGFGHYGWVWIVALVAILAFALYRRGRRLIGHQRLIERRIVFRIAVFAVIAVALLFTYAHRSNPALEYESAAAGFVLGAIIALFALRFTKMGRDEHGLWYVPNLYLGIGLIALLIARFAYEYFAVLPEMQRQAEAAAAAKGSAYPVLASQPVLHGVLYLVLGYYLIYYAGILLRAKRLESEPPTQDREEN